MLESQEHGYVRIDSIPGVDNVEEQLRNSTGSCTLCHLIYQAICNDGPAPKSIVQYDFVRGIHLSAASEMLLIEVVGENGSGINYSSIDFRSLRIWTDPGSDAESTMGVEVGLSIQPHADQAAHYSLLREWLQDCDTHHSEHSPSSDTVLPTRVLEVGAKGDPTVRLYERAKDERSRYITLSHRWGADELYRKPLSTTKKNISDHLREIRFEDLPPLFQDAVTVVRELGVPYL